MTARKKMPLVNLGPITRTTSGLVKNSVDLPPPKCWVLMVQMTEVKPKPRAKKKGKK